MNEEKKNFMKKLYTVRSLYNDMYEDIMGKGSSLIRNKIAEIAVENSNLMRVTHSRFIYRDIKYNPLPYITASKREEYSVLHPTLWEKMDKILELDIFNTEYNKSILKNLLNDVLNHASCMSDMYKLLPECTKILLSAEGVVAEYGVFEGREPLTAENLNEVKRRNMRGYTCLNEIGLIKLIGG